MGWRLEQHEFVWETVDLFSFLEGHSKILTPNVLSIFSCLIFDAPSFSDSAAIFLTWAAAGATFFFPFSRSAVLDLGLLAMVPCSQIQSVTRVSQKRPVWLKILWMLVRLSVAFCFSAFQQIRKEKKHQWQQAHSGSHRWTSRISKSLLHELATYYLLRKLVFCFEKISFSSSYAVVTLLVPSKTSEYRSNEYFYVGVEL